MANKNITFKDIVERQKKDLKARVMGDSIYRKVSLIFTYIFVKLRISPNAITISSYFLSILGYIFLSLGTYIYLIVGLSFFCIFYIFDAADGEIARLFNKKSIEGLFFDEISHIIWDIGLGIGLGYGLAKLYENNIYLSLGFLVTLAFVLEHTVTFALRSSLMKEIIVNKIQVREPNLIIKKMYLFIYNGRTWSNQNIFLKIIGIYPFKGLLYSVHYFSTILILLTIIEFIINSFIDIQITVLGAKSGLIPFYLLMTSVVKLYYSIVFIYKMEKNKYITKFIEDSNF